MTTRPSLDDLIAARASILDEIRSGPPLKSYLEWDESNEESNALYSAWLNARARFEEIIKRADPGDWRSAVRVTLASGSDSVVGEDVVRWDDEFRGGQDEFPFYGQDDFGPLVIMCFTGMPSVDEARVVLADLRKRTPQVLVSNVSPDAATAAKRELRELAGIIAIVSEARSVAGSGRRPIPASVRREVWRRDQGRCVDCGSRERLEFDHIIPVSQGGSDTARNIELRCESCNRRKAASI